MNARPILMIMLPALALWASGCTGAQRLDLAEQTGGSAALFGQFRAYDGRTGRPLTFAQVVRRCAAADVVLVGERHSDAVCNQIEAQLLAALLAQRRPVALAMEFFEADTQASVDAYLARRIDESAFYEQTRRSPSYVRSHRPLVELCRAAGVPVIAANAPRGLVRAYRVSGQPYSEFRAALDPEQQRWLPPTCEDLGGAYRERFMEVMASHVAPPAPATPEPSEPAASPADAPSVEEMTTPAPTSAPSAEEPAAADESAAEGPAVAQPAVERSEAASPAAFYRAQLLWDEAMADALAAFRERFSAHRMMLVVGAFHVAHEGGTTVKYRQRRPQDHVVTVVYVASEDGALAFDQADRGAGDILVYGVTPPPSRRKAEPAGSSPGEAASGASPGVAAEPVSE
jgi:uncharacterized iron-regulated protein